MEHTDGTGWTDDNGFLFCFAEYICLYPILFTVFIEVG
jgi:hypothetical protein